MKAIITCKVIIKKEKEFHVQYRIWYVLFIPVFAYDIT